MISNRRSVPTGFGMELGTFRFVIFVTVMALVHSFILGTVSSSLADCMRYSGPPRFHMYQYSSITTVFHQLHLCSNSNLDNVALLRDSNNNNTDTRRKILKRLIDVMNQPFNQVFFQNGTELTTVLYDMYVKSRIMTYILMTSNPNDVLSMAASVFFRYKSRELFAMPHRTRWLVLVHTSHDFNTFLSYQQKSVFDNVAVIQIHTDRSESDHFTIKRVVSLMWSPNRRRHPNHIPEGLLTSKTCQLYPNQKYGLNGREIVAVAKPYVKHLFNTTYNDHTKKYEYSGIHVNILLKMSQALNFTYRFLPIDTNNLTWVDIMGKVRAGLVDVNLNLWAYSIDLGDNLSLSYPLMFDRLTGIYIPKERSAELSTFLFCPFPEIIYAILGGSVAGCCLLYTFLDLSYSKIISSANSKTHPGKQFVQKILTNLCNLLLSVINIDNLPRPGFSSGRFLLCFWSLGMVFFYSAYSSYLTSSLIKDRQDPPINTFQELMADGRYKLQTRDMSIDFPQFGQMNDSVSKYVFQNTYSIADPRDPQVFVKQSYWNMKNNNSVTLYQEKLYKLLLDDLADSNKQHDVDTSEVVFMKEKLFFAPLAFLFPGKSELEEMVSMFLVNDYENGQNDRYFFDSSRRRQAKEEDEGGRKFVAMSDIYFLLLVTAISFVVALFVLVLEKWVMAYRRRRVGTQINNE